MEQFRRAMFFVCGAGLVAGPVLAYQSDEPPARVSLDAAPPGFLDERASVTQPQLDAAMVEYLIAHTDRAYEKSKWRNAKWDDAAKKVHDAYASALVRGLRETDWEPTMSLVRSAQSKQCNDPLVLAFIAYVHDRYDTKDEGSTTMAACEALRDSPYHIAFSLPVTARSGFFYKAAGQPAKQGEALDRTVAGVLDMMADKSFPGRAGLEFRAMLAERWADPDVWGFTSQAVAARLPADERIEPWLKSLYLGEREIGLAWQARGGEFAFKVTDEQWKGFEVYLKSARAHLEASFAARSDMPHAASGMIRVAMGGHAAQGENERVWFERAVKARFDYLPAYRAMRWALHPRWGGSLEGMLAFGRAAADSKRYDTEVPIELMYAAYDLGKETKDLRDVLALPGLSADLDTALAGCMSDPSHPDVRHRDWCSERLALAYAAGEFVRLGEIDAIRSKKKYLLNGTVMGEWDIDVTDVRNAAALARSKRAEDGIRLLRAVREKRWHEAIPLADTLEQHFAMAETSDADSRRAASDLYVLALAAKTLAENKTFEVPIMHALRSSVPGMRSQVGSWRLDFESAVPQITGRPANGARLLSAFEVGTRFEMSATLDVSTMRHPAAQAGRPPAKDRVVQAGFMVGCRYHPGQDSSWIGVHAVFGEDALVIGAGLKQVQRVPCPGLGDTAEIRVQAWDENIRVFVDGVERFTGAAKYSRNRWGHRIGLEIYDPDSSGINESVNYTNIRITPLQTAPAWFVPPPDELPEAPEARGRGES